MRLSNNFMVREFTYSTTSYRKGIPNNPTEEHMANLKRLVDSIIQPLRDKIGPIRISSGYRSPALNRVIGGSSRSQHCKGMASDLQFVRDNQMANKIIFDNVIEMGLDFDQMINEFDYKWIHISYNEKKNRKQILEAYKDEKNKTRYMDITSNHLNIKLL
jgi:zinc D-Ala-D-Ala carboxypeptidase